MRKLIVCNIMSLDSFYEGPGKNVMGLPFDEAFDVYNAERLRAADTLLLGRTSYEGFKSHWPPVADDPDDGPVVREISRRNNESIVTRAAAHEQITELKGQAGQEILVFGSHRLWKRPAGRRPRRRAAPDDRSGRPRRRARPRSRAGRSYLCDCSRPAPWRPPNSYAPGTTPGR